MFLNSSSLFRLQIHNLISLVHWYTTFWIFISSVKKVPQMPYSNPYKASKSSLTLNLHSFATTNNNHITQKYKHNKKRYRRGTQPLELRKETISDIVMSVHPHHFIKIFSILNASSFVTLRSPQSIVWLIDYKSIPTRFRNWNPTSSLPKAKKLFENHCFDTKCNIPVGYY